MIFDYKNPSLYLLEVFNRLKSRNERYSIRSWARALKMGNAATLLKVLKEERRIPLKMLHELNLFLKLNEEESTYLELMAVGHKKMSDKSFETLRFLLKEHERQKASGS